MNNEPVAWMTETDGVNYFSIIPVKRDAIPLYDRPAKTIIGIIPAKVDSYSARDLGWSLEYLKGYNDAINDTRLRIRSEE